MFTSTVIVAPMTLRFVDSLVNLEDTIKIDCYDMMKIDKFLKY